MLKYSHRLSWSFSTNPQTDAIEKARRSGRKLVDLTSSNPTTVGLDYPHSALAEAFGALQDFTYEPQALGAWPVRCAIADDYTRQQIVTTPEQICLTASTSEAYALLFKLLCNEGDHVLTPSPSYPLFEYLAALEGVRLMPYHLRYDGRWFVDFDDLESKIDGSVRAIIVVNPNNPTGSVLKRDEWNRVFDLAERHNLPVIADEVFGQFALTPDVIPSSALGSRSVLTFSLNGLSKACGMPQLKLGWIAMDGPSEEWQRARSRLELILDTYLSVNTPAQLAVSKLLSIGSGTRTQLQERIRMNYNVAETILAGSPAHTLHTEAGWSTIIRLPNVLSEEEWMDYLLREAELIVQPGYFFELPFVPCAVVSLITPPDQFRSGLVKIKELTTAYGQPT